MANKASALALLLWPAAATAFNSSGLIGYARRWVATGAHALPDPCAPPAGACNKSGAACTGSCGKAPGQKGEPGHMQGSCAAGDVCEISMQGYGKTFGPDGQGGCIKDTDPSDGTGRFPFQDGATPDEGSYASKWANAMWKKHAPPAP